MATNQQAESLRKVTFKTTLEEEKNRTVKATQWRERKKQVKARRMQEAKIDERERKEALMQKVYDELLAGERLQRAMNESERLSVLEQSPNEDHNSAALDTYNFLSEWRGLCLMWKVGTKGEQEPTALQQLGDFRQKYAGMKMEQALCGSSGARDVRRARSLESFASNGVVKSYLGLWRRTGALDGDDTTSGEDLRCYSSIYREIFRRLASGDIIARYVDEELFLMMPKSSGDDGAPPPPPTAAAAAVGGVGVPPNPPQRAAIQAFEAEEDKPKDKPEASDTYKKRNHGDDKKIPATTTTSNTGSPRKKPKGLEGTQTERHAT